MILLYPLRFSLRESYILVDLRITLGYDFFVRQYDRDFHLLLNKLQLFGSEIKNKPERNGGRPKKNPLQLFLVLKVVIFLVLWENIISTGTTGNV